MILNMPKDLSKEYAFGKKNRRHKIKCHSVDQCNIIVYHIICMHILCSIF